MKSLRFESIGDVKKKVRSGFASNGFRMREAESLVDTIETIKRRIKILNSNLNDVTDPMLIEGYVYELKALHIKYDFFIKKCKDDGLTVDFV